MFTVLPDVLQDLVVQFAFKIDKKELKGDLDLIFEIKQWELHPCFLRHRVFVSDPWIFVNNPLETYFPLQKLKSMFEMFDMCVIQRSSTASTSGKAKSGLWVLGRIGSDAWIIGNFSSGFHLSLTKLRGHRVI